MNNNKIIVTFLDGPKVQIDGTDDGTKYTVQFYNRSINELVYGTDIGPGHWTAPSPKYYIPWEIIVDDHKTEPLRVVMDLRDRDVLIAFDSKSLGDNTSWIPYVEEFREQHDCRITVMTYWNNILASEYPDLKFVSFDAKDLPIFYTVYRLGAFDNDYNKNRNNWRLIPLQQIASDMLGLPYEEIKPKVTHGGSLTNYGKPYVCISEFSTWFAKQWLYIDGWNKLVELIREQGYEVISISRESSNLKGVVKLNGRPIEETIGVLQFAKAFIGVSTGLLVVAWALDVPTVCVSGATGLYSEMKSILRVVNDKVCHGCFADITLLIDRGNWKYCPRGRNFECTRSITPEMVWEKLQPLLPAVISSTSVVYDVTAFENKLKEVMPKQLNSHEVEVNKTGIQLERGGKARVLFITPHCSTGGGPQYLLKCVEKIKDAGHTVEVIEYSNISDDYVVQKNKIKALVPFHTMNGNKLTNLNTVFSRFNPDIVHLHEFPERFLENDVADLLYSKHRKYKIIETAHGIGLPPRLKRYRPDVFAFVGKYHAKEYKDFGVPIEIVEYQIDTLVRPDRAFALSKLELDPNQYHVLNVGLFTPDKNQGFIFEVAKLVDAQFHFVGNRADNFKPYWGTLTVPTNCRLWGEQEDVDKFYSAMDLFLFSSLKECNPIVIKEALSWNMPVLMYRNDVYCGDYDDNPLVTFIDGDVEWVADELCKRREPIGMTGALLRVYDLAVRS